MTTSISSHFRNKNLRIETNLKKNNTLSDDDKNPIYYGLLSIIGQTTKHAELYVTGRHFTDLNAPLPENFEEGARNAIVQALPTSEPYVINEKIKTLRDWVNAFIKGQQGALWRVKGECPKLYVQTQQILALMPEEARFFYLESSGPPRYFATFNWISDGSSFGIYLIKESRSGPKPILKNTRERESWSYWPLETVYQDYLKLPSKANTLIMLYLGGAHLNTLTVQFIEESTEELDPLERLEIIEDNPNINIDDKELFRRVNLKIDLTTFEAMQITVFNGCNVGLEESFGDPVFMIKGTSNSRIHLDTAKETSTSLTKQ